MDTLQPILGRTLVLVAHPDDEAVGCGALLQRMRDPLVVFATDGAPRSEYFWKHYGSREAYAAERAIEARYALAAVGITDVHLLLKTNPVADQELFLNLNCAYDALARLIDRERPDAILTLAYEGGHPDHDTCCFLASFAARQFGLPVWEMPLYHRANGDTVRQRFISGDALSITPLIDELRRKQKMFATYKTQAHVLAEFDPKHEAVRPLRDYDFSRPPHSGELNYEAWRWPMTGADLCSAFERFIAQHSTEEGFGCGTAA